ncbi:MAG: DUF1524 domain-containing protein [Betaproteobacteria bacterium]|nr:DUF1524 domain-containing protein [Betaproteobacteria bacterium]
MENRSTSGKRLRYLLAKIERQLGGVEISDEAMTATVEHILPESPAQAGWDHFRLEAHERSFERLNTFTERNQMVTEPRTLRLSLKLSIYSHCLTNVQRLWR